MATVQRKTEVPSYKGAPAKPVARKIRRDWGQITFYVLSIIIVLSMILGSLSMLFQ